MNRQTIVAGLSKLQASRIATLTANERLLEDSLLPVSQEIEMLQRKQEETLIDLSKTFAKIKNAEASFLDQVIESLAKKRRAAREEKERLEEAIRLKRLEAERLEQEQRDHEAALAQRMAQEEQARLAAEKEQRLAAERQRDQMSQYEKVYEPYVSQYEQLRTSYHPEKIDSTLRLEIKMKLNKRVSQVSPSKAQVLGIVKDLDNVLNMAKAASNEMYAYALELLYEKVMAQGQAQVALNVPSAFPLSALIVTLSQSQSPPFIQCLFGKLVKECSFVAGEMPSPLSGESTMEYGARIGYKKSGLNGNLESQDAWNERQTGILYIFAAILQQAPLTSHAFSTSSIDAAFDVNLMWIFVSSLLNKVFLPTAKLTRQASPMILVTFLEICGYSMFRTYGSIFWKLLTFIRDQYLPMILEKRKLEDIGLPALTRLELYLQEAFKKGVIERPKGSELHE